MKKELVYTTGETLLLKTLIKQNQKNITIEKSNYLWEVISVFDRICTKFGTLSEVNYQIHTGKFRYIDSEYNIEMIEALFHKDLDIMPLLINNPITGTVAKFRLQIGK